MLQLRLQSRTAILARAADAPERSRLTWCTDRECTEQAFTRDNRFDLAFLGIAPMEGRSRVWLRERSGTVFGCAPVEGPGEDRFDCTPTTLAFPDVAASTSEPSEADPLAVIAARKRLDDARRDAFTKSEPIARAANDAILRNDRATADRLVAQVRLIDPSGPALRFLAGQYRKKGW